MSILEDYWRISKKATDALETELEKLKVAKTHEIKKEILFDFIEMHKDYLDIHAVGIVKKEYHGFINQEMYYVGSGFFYDNVSRILYIRLTHQNRNFNPVLVRLFGLSSDEEINAILKFIEEQFKNYIESRKSE